MEKGFEVTNGNRTQDLSRVVKKILSSRSSQKSRRYWEPEAPQPSRGLGAAYASSEEA